MTTSINNIYNNIDDFLDKKTTFLDNEYISLGLIIVFILLCNIITPKIPYKYNYLINNIIVKFFIIFTGLYLMKRNFKLALIGSIIYLFIINALDVMFNIETMENINNNIPNTIIENNPKKVKKLRFLIDDKSVYPNESIDESMNNTYLDDNFIN